MAIFLLRPNRFVTHIRARVLLEMGLEYGSCIICRCSQKLKQTKYWEGREGGGRGGGGGGGGGVEEEEEEEEKGISFVVTINSSYLSEGQ